MLCSCVSTSYTREGLSSDRSSRYKGFAQRAPWAKVTTSDFSLESHKIGISRLENHSVESVCANILLFKVLQFVSLDGLLVLHAIAVALWTQT